MDERALDFAAAASRQEKRDIVLERLATFKAQGGRMVRKWNRNGVYYEVTEKKQYRKTIQRLRDKKMNAIDEFDLLPDLEIYDDFLPYFDPDEASLLNALLLD